VADFGRELAKEIREAKTSAAKPTNVAGLPFQAANYSTESASGAPLNSSRADDAVAPAEHDDTRFPPFDHSAANLRETHDGKQVALLSLERSGPIEHDLAGAWIAGNGVRFEPISVCHIAAHDPLVGNESTFLHQIQGDGQTAFVANIATRNRGSMDLRLKQAHLHKSATTGFRKRRVMV